MGGYIAAHVIIDKGRCTRHCSCTSQRRGQGEFETDNADFWAECLSLRECRVHAFGAMVTPPTSVHARFHPSLEASTILDPLCIRLYRNAKQRRPRRQLPETSVPCYVCRCRACANCSSCRRASSSIDMPLLANLSDFFSRPWRAGQHAMPSRPVYRRRLSSPFAPPCVRPRPRARRGRSR